MKNIIQRRYFLKLIGSSLVTLLLPIQALAALWNKPAFEATQLNIAKQALAINNEATSVDITIIAPTFAETAQSCRLK